MYLSLKYSRVTSARSLPMVHQRLDTSRGAQMVLRAEESDCDPKPDISAVADCSIVTPTQEHAEKQGVGITLQHPPPGNVEEVRGASLILLYLARDPMARLLKALLLLIFAAFACFSAVYATPNAEGEQMSCYGTLWKR